jgi:hypothetical protein
MSARLLPPALSFFQFETEPAPIHHHSVFQHGIPLHRAQDADHRPL